MAQRLKRLLPMWETRLRSLGREDLLQKEMVTLSSILAWRIPWTEEPGSPRGRKKSDTTERLHSLTHSYASSNKEQTLFLQSLAGCKLFLSFHFLVS